MTKLAEVFVQVRLDTRGITAEAEKSGTSAGNAAEGGFKRAFNPLARFKVSADTTKAKAEIDDLRRRIARTTGKSIELRARVALENAEANRKIADLKGELLTLNREKVNIDGDTSGIDEKIAKVKADIADIGQSRSVAKAQLALDDTKAKAELAFMKAELDKFGATKTTRTVEIKQKLDSLGENAFGNITTAAAAIGPALLPVLGAATVAVGTLGAALGAAGGAAGAFGLSVVGQVKAMTTAQAAIKTTTTALGKLAPGTDAYRAKLKELNSQTKDFNKQFGPAAKGFTAMKTAFSGFQTATSHVTLGVMGKALQGVAGVLPKLAPLANAAGIAVGGLVDKFVNFTKGDTFDGVLSFFQVNGPKAITAFGTSLGNVAVGFGGILAAFAPMQGGLLSGLTSITGKFAAWGKSLGSSDGFSKFMSYIQSTLPQVLGLLQQLGTFIGHLVVAMAPLGKIELGALTAFFGVINSLPIGVITAAAGAFTVLALALKTMAVAGAAMGAGQKLGLIATNTEKAGVAAGKSAPAVAGMSRSMMGLRAGAGAAGLGLSILSSKLEANHKSLSTLTQVAADAAFGFSVAGPWGAAVGGAIGIATTWSSSTDGMRQSMSNLSAVSKSGTLDFGARNKALGEARDATLGLAKANTTLGAEDFTPAGIVGMFQDHTKEIQAAIAKQHDFDVSTHAMQEGVLEFNQKLNGETGVQGFTNDLGEIQTQAKTVVTALTGAGYSAGAIDKLLRTHKGWDAAIAAAKKYQQSQDSVAGQMGAVGDAITGIGRNALTSAESASALGTALASAVGPNIGLTQATDTVAAAFDHWDQSLAKNSKSLKGQSDASRQNRAAVDDRVNAVLAQNVAEVAAHKHSKQTAYDLEANRNKLLATGRAAGLGGKELRTFVNQAGLTPRLIRSEFKAAGITPAARAAHDLAGRYKTLPKNVQTYIKTHGIPSTKADLADLKGKFKNLSKSDIKVIAALMDHASPKVRALLGRILHLDKTHAKPTADLTTSGFDSRQLKVFHTMDSLDGKTANPKVNATSNAESVGKQAKLSLTIGDTKTKIVVSSNAKTIGKNAHTDMSIKDTSAKIGVSSNAASVARTAHSSMQISDTYATIHINTVRTGKKSADGGLISGPGGPRDDAIPAWLSNGEFVVNAAATSRNLTALHAMNAQKFAVGGLVRMADGGHHHHKPTEAEQRAAHKAHRHSERALDKGLHHFDKGFSSKDSASDTRSSFATLLNLLKDAVGKHSPLVKHLKELGEKLVAAQRAQDKAQKAWERGIDKLDKIKAAAADYRKTVTAAYTHDAFGGSLHDLDLQERADTNDARAADKALAIAKHRGLGGKGGRGLLKELMASGNLALLEEFSHLSHKEIQHQEALYRRRQHATGHIGADAAHDVYGKSIREQTHEVKHLHKVVERLNHHLMELEHRVERGARQGVHDGTKDRDRTHGAGRKGHHH